jgi:hypothetical protein
MVSVEEQPLTLVPVPTYFVVVAGVAVNEPPVVALTPVEGDHV